MQWITVFPFFAVAIFMQTLDVQGINDAVWSNAETAEAVLQFFSDFLEYSGLFNNHQMNEIKEIGDTITMLLDQMILRKKSSSAIFQALDLAFASSIAKLISREDQGESLNRKKSAIFDAFKAALKHVAGAEDPVYLSEIKELVSLFADESSTNAGTPLASQTETFNSATPETQNYFSPLVNIQDNSAHMKEVKSPSRWILYPESQSSYQQLLNQDEHFPSAGGPSKDQSFDLGIIQNSQISSIDSSFAVGAEIKPSVSSSGGESFDSGVIQNSLSSSAASSVSDADEINLYIPNKFDSEQPEDEFLSTSVVLTGTQVLQQPDSTGPNYATRKVYSPQQKFVASSVSTSADINSENHPPLYGTNSNDVLSFDTSQPRTGGESLNEQASGIENTATELFKGNDFQKSSPSYDSQSSAISIFADTLSDELYYSDIFYDVFEGGISPEEAVSALIALTQSVSGELGINDIVNELIDSVQSSVSFLYPSTHASEYAIQYSAAIAEVLAKNEIITTETANDDAYIYADSVEYFLEETPLNQLTAVLGTSNVETQNKENAPVENYDVVTNERSIVENYPSNFADVETGEAISIVPDTFSRASRLSSESSISRIKSVISEIFLLEEINSNNLGSIVSELGRLISSERPDLSECDMLNQVYSEILSALIYILNTGDDYRDDASFFDESSAIVSEAMKYLM